MAAGTQISLVVVDTQDIRKWRSESFVLIFFSSLVHSLESICSDHSNSFPFRCRSIIDCLSFESAQCPSRLLILFPRALTQRNLNRGFLCMRAKKGSARVQVGDFS